MSNRTCIECHQTLDVSQFTKYSDKHYRERCNTCFTAKPVVRLTAEQLEHVKQTIREVYPSRGVLGVVALLPWMSKTRITTIASRISVRSNKRKPKTAPDPEIDAIIAELRNLPPGYALRAYRTPSGRITMNPIGKVCAIWERDIGRHGKTARIDIEAARAKLIAAKGAA